MTRRKPNTARLEADADRIAQRFRDGTSLIALMREYRSGYRRMSKTLRARLGGPEYKALCSRNHAKGNKRTRFKKGMRPWNKGIKGLRHSPATEFKPGCIRGMAARRYTVVGAITIRKDHPKRRGRPGRPKSGCLRRFIKVKDDGRPQDRWLPYARYIWQKHNGPIAPGYIVVHADGDFLNDAIENLRLLNRRQHLAFQQSRNPDMVPKQRRNVVRTNKKRFAAQRCVSAYRKMRASHQLAKWQCPACGNEWSNKQRPKRCEKCGNYSLEKVRVPA